MKVKIMFLVLMLMRWQQRQLVPASVMVLFRVADCTIGTTKKRYSLKLKGVYNSDTYSVFLFWFDKITTVWFDNMKLEKGNKATDWTPAPEDVATDAQSKADAAKQAAITDAAGKYTTKTEHSSSITQLNNSIALKVAKTDFNALGTRVSTAETTIRQHTDQIALKAAKTDVTALGTRGFRSGGEDNT